MIREWADEDTNEQIEMALMPKGAAMAATWDDDEAWAQFENALRAERR